MQKEVIGWRKVTHACHAHHCPREGGKVQERHKRQVKRQHAFHFLSHGAKQAEGKAKCVPSKGK